MAPDNHKMEIIAHRGASHDAPENTLAAFNLAWQQNADAGELDIHLTQDGQIVVLHDDNTQRTAGADKPVAGQTLAEVRALDAGSWKGAVWKNEKIPTLAEALATIPDGKRMFVEIKCGAEVLPELERVLKASGKTSEQLPLIGFDFQTMRLAKERLPLFPCFWLVSRDKNKQFPPIETLIEKAKTAHLDGLDLDFNFPVDAAFVAQVKAQNLGLFVWTVDDAAVARRLAAAGVDGITTNRPAWLREQLKPPIAR